MDFELQQKGLDNLLAAIYGNETHLLSLLRELGFEQSQIDGVRGEALQALVSSFLDSVHTRLTSDSGQDTYYQVLSRRYGLDGLPPASLDEIAVQRGMDRRQLSQLFGEILTRCQSQTAQKELRQKLKHLAVARLAQAAGRPSREHVAEKLERLSNLKSAADITRLDYEAKRLEILKKVQAELDALEVEYQPLLESVEENIDDLENEIKTDVLLHGESVSGGMFRAVYTQGRVSWDTSKITRYAEAHPEVLEFRRQGAPSVALRIIAGKD